MAAEEQGNIEKSKQQESVRAIRFEGSRRTELVGLMKNGICVPLKTFQDS